VELLKSFKVVYIFLGVVVLLALALALFYLRFRSVSSEPSTAVFTENAIKESSFITVDIGGAVHTPGVYSVDSQARVADVVNKAGGIHPDASALWVSKNINLASKLSDSEKIYIPFSWEIETSEEILLLESTVSNKQSKTASASSTPVEPSAELLNLNTATAEELDELPGIGPVYADKIISNKPYSSREELLLKSGLSESVIKKIENMVSYK
jgi:competence protein ComEA